MERIITQEEYRRAYEDVENIECENSDELYRIIDLYEKQNGIEG